MRGLQVLGLTFALGCGFFEELADADSASSGTASDSGASAGTSTSTSDTDGPCTLQHDDYCEDQDRLQQCSAEGEIAHYDCSAECGQFVNFSCVMLGTGQHGCWCVEPGVQKVLSCSELEFCLQKCTTAVGSSCADQCFARTDAATVRLYGALTHCAHESCRTSCWEQPETCASCIERAITQGEPGCGFERSVCESDVNDEPFG